MIATAPLAPAAPRAVASTDRRRHPLRLIQRRLVRDRGALVSVAVLLLIVGLALAAPLLPVADPLEQNLVGRLVPPGWTAEGSWEHPLGTDQLGRDILSRVVWGARVSLVVGISAVLIAGTLGVSIGVLAGYVGGHVDNLLMRLADGQLAIPFILLVIAVIAVVGPASRE